MAGKIQSRRVASENLRRKNRKRTIEIAKNRQVDKTRAKAGINASLAGINSKTWATREDAAARARMSFLDIWVIRIAQKSLFFYMVIVEP